MRGFQAALLFLVALEQPEAFVPQTPSFQIKLMRSNEATTILSSRGAPGPALHRTALAATPTEPDEAKIRKAYEDWCRDFGKEPNDRKYDQFAANYKLLWSEDADETEVKKDEKDGINGTPRTPAESAANAEFTTKPKKEGPGFTMVGSAEALKDEFDKFESLPEEDRIKLSYKEWCKDNGKPYEEKRLPLFAAHYKQVASVNKDSRKRVKLNKYADLTPTEFKSKRKEIEADRKAAKERKEGQAKLNDREALKRKAKKERDALEKIRDATRKERQENEGVASYSPASSQSPPSGSTGIGSFGSGGSVGAGMPSYASGGSYTGSSNPPAGMGSYVDVRKAYQEWCQVYGKKEDSTRFNTFAQNYQQIDAFYKKQGKPIRLNGYADLSPEEYSRKQRENPAAFADSADAYTPTQRKGKVNTGDYEPPPDERNNALKDWEERQARMGPKLQPLSPDPPRQGQSRAPNGRGRDEFDPSEYGGVPTAPPTWANSGRSFEPYYPNTEAELDGVPAQPPRASQGEGYGGTTGLGGTGTYQGDRGSNSFGGGRGSRSFGGGRGSSSFGGGGGGRGSSSFGGGRGSSGGGRGSSSYGGGRGSSSYGGGGSSSFGSGSSSSFGGGGGGAFGSGGGGGTGVSSSYFPSNNKAVGGSSRGRRTASRPPTTEHAKGVYQKWCKYYNKTPSAERFQTFASNLVEVEAYYKKTGEDVEMNEYSDMTADEYKSLKRKQDITPSPQPPGRDDPSTSFLQRKSQAEAEARRKAADEERRLAAEVEAKRRTAEERRRIAEEAAQTAEEARMAAEAQRMRDAQDRQAAFEREQRQSADRAEANRIAKEKERKRMAAERERLAAAREAKFQEREQRRQRLAKRVEEEGQKRAAAAAEAQKQAQQVQQRMAQEADAKRKAEDDARRRKSEEQQQQQQQQRQAEEARIAAEKARALAEEETRKKAEEDRRRAAEEGRRQMEADQARQQAQAREEQQRREAEQAKQAQEQARANEAQRNEDEQRRMAAQAENQRRAEEEQRRSAAAENESQRRAEEEQQRNMAAEAESQRRADDEKRRQAAAEEQNRRAQAEEAAARAQEEEQARRAQGEEQARRAEEDRRRVAAETQARQLAEDEERRRRDAVQQDQPAPGIPSGLSEQNEGPISSTSYLEQMGGGGGIPGPGANVGDGSWGAKPQEPVSADAGSPSGSYLDGVQAANSYTSPGQDSATGSDAPAGSTSYLENMVGGADSGPPPDSSYLDEAQTDGDEGPISATSYLEQMAGGSPPPAAAGGKKPAWGPGAAKPAAPNTGGSPFGWSPGEVQSNPDDVGN